MHHNSQKTDRQISTSELISHGKSPYLVSVRRKSKLISQKLSQKNTVITPKHSNLITLLADQQQKNNEKKIVETMKKKVFKRDKRFEAYQNNDEIRLNSIKVRSGQKLTKYKRRVEHHTSNQTMCLGRKQILGLKFGSYKSIGNSVNNLKRERSDKFRTRSHSKSRIDLFLNKSEEKQENWLCRQLISKEIYALDDSSDF